MLATPISVPLIFCLRPILALHSVAGCTFIPGSKKVFFSITYIFYEYFLTLFIIIHFIRSMHARWLQAEVAVCSTISGVADLK